jgi:hypothetical protein
MPAAFPENVEFFDASFNQLDGTVPTIPNSMIHLNLEENELNGGLPSFGSRRRRHSSRKLQWKAKIVIDADKVGGPLVVGRRGEAGLAWPP